MILLLHTAAHIISWMGKLRNPIEVEQFENYTQTGYWMIQKYGQFWLGMFTDKTIAQYLVLKLVVGFDVWEGERLLQYDK